MNLRAESKQNQIRSNSSNLVPTRTTRTVGNILFSTLPVHVSKQSRPITCPVALIGKISGSGLQIGDRVWAEVEHKTLHSDRSNRIKFYLRWTILKVQFVKKTAQSSGVSQKINTTESQNSSDNCHKIFQLGLIRKY